MKQETKFYFWLALRMLMSRGSQLFSLSGLNALTGLILGVACLVVSMAVMSGFESTLRQSVVDVTGHIQILIKSSSGIPKKELVDRIKVLEPSFQAATRFSYLEAVMAHEGKISGVVLQGLDPEDVTQVLGMQKRLIDGKFQLKALEDGKTEKVDQALIGRGLAAQMDLKVGDRFRLVLPLRNDLDPSQFRRKLGTFQVSGVLDLGKYEYNQRMILTSLEATQKLAEIGDRYSGLLLKFKEVEKSRAIAAKLGAGLGSGYIIRDWKEVNENLFEAVGLERVVVFFVILVIVIAAAFNVASTLYVNVVTRYSEIGLLKSMGVSKKRVAQIFSFQGLVMGFIGLCGGLLLGAFLCFLFGWVESQYSLLPGSIYRVDRIDLLVRPVDILMISAATLLICFVATLAPALRGSSLSPVEGLKNE